MNQHKARPRKGQWLIVTLEEASGQKVALSAKRAAADVYIKYLILSDEQQQQIDLLYQEGAIQDMKFRNLNDEDQLRATSVLGIHHLDLGARKMLGSRWSVKWSKVSGQGVGKNQRVLYQWYVKNKSRARHQPHRLLTQ